MKKFNIDRRTEPVIGIGGGVCLDVVGLAASLFRHKTPYIRVPTTSLAYVDASVGAKNGCNFLGSKNRLGTYVPPVAALLDSSFFRTQPSWRGCPRYRYAPKTQTQHAEQSYSTSRAPLTQRPLATQRPAKQTR